MLCRAVEDDGEGCTGVCVAYVLAGSSWCLFEGNECNLREALAWNPVRGTETEETESKRNFGNDCQSQSHQHENALYQSAFGEMIAYISP